MRRYMATVGLIVKSMSLILMADGWSRIVEKRDILKQETMIK
jgi:hypothetical protein